VSSGKIDRELIRERNERLEAAGAALKAVFVGIDAVIDQLVDAIRIWYLMPEVLARPVIVNLWGMTGVGKTDLVRRLVRALDCQDRFCEVELSNGDTTSWLSSVATVLEASNLNDELPKIVLFDEIQRFNTLDSDGKPLENTKFTDFWARMPEDTSTVAEMSRSTLIDRIRLAKQAKRVYEPVDHSKTLIIVSGNLDEAFTMSRLTGEADVDADIFHALTQKITLVDIKQALARRFKPEQVSRFGNIHLIYTSLRRADFEEVIRREIVRVARSARERFGIAVAIDETVHTLVYRNGVFPTQGVRPVFSSVIDIVESTMSRLLFEALMSGGRRIALRYDVADRRLLAQVGRTRSEIPYVGRLDSVRQRNAADVVANVSVHEAGHAVAYAVLFGSPRCS
jgi:cell division protease FtsH